MGEEEPKLTAETGAPGRARSTASVLVNQRGLMAVSLFLGSALVAANAFAAWMSASVAAWSLSDVGPPTISVAMPWWPAWVGVALVALALGLFVRRQFVTEAASGRGTRAKTEQWSSDVPARRVSILLAVGIGFGFMAFGVTHPTEWHPVYYPQYGPYSSPDPLFLVGLTLFWLAFLAALVGWRPNQQGVA